MNAVRPARPGYFSAGVVELPGRSLHHVECGEGRPVVLLHGYTDSWHSFRLVLPLLAGHARCVALDQRGHGDSAYEGDDFSLDAFADDVVGVIEGLRLGPAAVVGHSMGSLVARKVVLARPDLVDRLVLVGTAPRMDTPAVRRLDADLAAFPACPPWSFVEAFQAGCVVERSSVPWWFFAGCVETSAGVSPRVWRGALAGIRADDHAARLSEIRCPALVIGGREDAFCGPQEHAEVAKALPRGRLLIYEGVGHSPHWERPARFAANVIGFLGTGG